jgi:hypothetical protein
VAEAAAAIVAVVAVVVVVVVVHCGYRTSCWMNWIGNSNVEA